MRLWMSTLAMLALSYASAALADSTTYLDATGKKYNGKDSDLDGFEIKNLAPQCDSTSGICVLSWENRLKRSFPRDCNGSLCQLQQLSSYTIHFLIADRSGAAQLKKSYKWARNKWEPDPKKSGAWVARDGDLNYIDAGKINLNYATVEYWATEIRWEKAKAVVEEEDPRTAVSLKTMLQELKDQKKAAPKQPGK